MRAPDKEFKPPELTILNAFDEQLSVPGHRPSRLYLASPWKLKMFNRAARRAKHHNMPLAIDEGKYKGCEVILTPAALAREQNGGDAWSGIGETI